MPAAIFSAIPYKTPWNLLPFYAGAFALAGVGFAALVNSDRPRWSRASLAGALAVGSIHLGWQAWRASITYAADPRNPYVYAQTVPDAVRMAARIRNLSALHPDGARMQVSVIAPPSEQWPLPWYLRAMPNVGYWTAPGDVLALQAPVIVSSLEHTPALEQALGDRVRVGVLRTQARAAPGRSTSTGDCGIASWPVPCREADWCADGDCGAGGRTPLRCRRSIAVSAAGGLGYIRRQAPRASACVSVERRRAHDEQRETVTTGPSRRRFMGTAAGATAGIMIVPRHVLGGTGFQAPSDTVNVAIVGYKHGMGTSNLMNVAKSDNIVALCDCDESEAARPR